jgi:hypothetical protein
MLSVVILYYPSFSLESFLLFLLRLILLLQILIHNQHVIVIIRRRCTYYYFSISISSIQTNSIFFLLFHSNFPPFQFLNISRLNFSRSFSSHPSSLHPSTKFPGVVLSISFPSFQQSMTHQFIYFATRYINIYNEWIFR